MPRNNNNAETLDSNSFGASHSQFGQQQRSSRQQQSYSNNSGFSSMGGGSAQVPFSPNADHMAMMGGGSGGYRNHHDGMNMLGQSPGTIMNNAGMQQQQSNFGNTNSFADAGISPGTMTAHSQRMLQLSGAGGAGVAPQFYPNTSPPGFSGGSAQQQGGGEMSNLSDGRVPGVPNPNQSQADREEELLLNLLIARRQRGRVAGDGGDKKAPQPSIADELARLRQQQQQSGGRTSFGGAGGGGAPGQGMGSSVMMQGGPGGTANYRRGGPGYNLPPVPGMPPIFSDQGTSIPTHPSDMMSAERIDRSPTRLMDARSQEHLIQNAYTTNSIRGGRGLKRGMMMGANYGSHHNNPHQLPNQLGTFEGANLKYQTAMEMQGMNLPHAKKKRTHKKKPADMPRRPLSAYNLFFSEERERILKEIDEKETGGSNKDNDKDAKDEDKGADGEDKNKGDGGSGEDSKTKKEGDSSSTTDENKKENGAKEKSATAAGDTENQSKKGDAADQDDQNKAMQRPIIPAQKKRRPHRKTHGKISFQELARMVGQRWKALPDDKRKYYQDLAKEDMKRQKTAMEEYYAKQNKATNPKQEEPPVGPIIAQQEAKQLGVNQLTTEETLETTQQTEI